ncbi:MAG: amino acid ABC transporter permease [Thaumarchaeota archaeon]|nr:amino acid ABC transporter permease [Nitrososphaerota archaeon]
MISLSKYLPYIFEGSLWSLGLVLGGLGIGFVIGVMFSLIQVYGSSPLRRLISLYVWFFRGTPLIVQLFLFHWSIFPALGIKSTPLITSITVLGLRSGAYQSQIFRGAIGSIEEKQMLAAKAIGMNDWDAISSIVLPQALRIALPQISNEYSIILKDSAICFILGVMELMTRAKYTAIATGIALIPYLMAGLIYIGLTYIGTKLFDLLYLKMRIPGSVEG